MRTLELDALVAGEKAAIEREITDFFERELAACTVSPLARRLLTALRDYTLRDGKRVRAVLLVLGYLSVGGKDLDKARRAAVSMELVQDMLLVHDDLMDRSPERRGGPSFHEHHRAIHLREGLKGDPERFGTSMALIGGDLAESLAVKALVGSGFDAERIRDAMLCQAEMVRDTGFGQVLDLYSTEVPEWTADMVLNVHRFKTARYTFEGPLHIGALLSGATRVQLRAISDFAIPVGIAFQLIDDILGFYGDPKRGGEEDLSDLKEGKRTMLIVDSLHLLGPEERSRVLTALGDGSLDLERARSIRSLVESTGAVERSRKLARELTETGVRSLGSAPLDPDVRRALSELAEGLLGRV